MEGVNLLVCPFSQQVDQIFQEVIKYGVRALKFTSDNIQSFENQIEDEQSDESERSQISELKDMENCQSSGDTQIINCKEDDSTCVSYTKKEVYSQLLKDKLKYSLVIVCVSRLNFKENSNFQSDQLFMDILNKWYDKNKLCKIYVSHAEIILQQETYKSHQNLKYIKQNFPKTPIVWEQIYTNQYRQFQIVKELNIDPNDILNFQTQIQYQPKVQSFSPNQIRFKVVLTKEDPYNPSIAHNENIWKIISQKLDQKILVYCQRKFRTIELSKYINYQINQMGNSEVKLSEANNSDLTEEQKKDIKERWNSNELKIVVTTTKFQYKVKNKDCQVIIHDSTPSSIVQYMDDCQLASDSCTCIMFHHSEDFKRIQRQLFNDFNKDTITEETKESDTLKLNQICQYAKTKDVCRKIMINEFMGNEKNLNNCQVCDNCKWIQKNGVQIKLIQQ